MKIIILTSSWDLRYGRGTDRVIQNAKKQLNTEFELVLYVSGQNFYVFCIGIVKILLNNPFSFSFIIFNAQSSIRATANPYWKFYYYFTKIFNVKRVLYWHEMPYFVEAYAAKSKLIQSLFKNKNTIQLCCSEANKQTAFIFDEQPNVTTINNCIVPRKFNKNFLLSKFTVITVGTVDHTKGADIWTNVAIKVCQQNKEIQFIWCGDGVDEKQMYDECLQKVKEVNLEDQISFLGKVEDAVVLTSAAHLYYCSSRLDSFPLAILEAMSQGKNIIYYASGGVGEAVGKSGFFIKDFSEDLTVNAVLDNYDTFKVNPETVFNKDVYDKFYNNYTPELFARKLKSALEKNV